jgi:hypothetical protein
MIRAILRRMTEIILTTAKDSGSRPQSRTAKELSDEQV